MGSIQFKLILTYVILLAVLLVMLNIYPVSMARDMVFKSKEKSISSTASMVASALTGLEYLTGDGVNQVLEMLDELGLTRLVITNADALVIYDSSGEALNKYALYPEICSAMAGNDVVHNIFNGQAFECSFAQPVMYRSNVIGVVYAYEFDSEQGELLTSIRRNFKNISIVIAIVFFAVSILFSQTLARRLHGIVKYLRVVGSGNYNERLTIRGNDELTELASEFNVFTERLKNTEEARKRFVSDASHELKTPLASIKLLTDSIIQNENIDPAMTREFLTDIGEEADRLSRITEKLLDITRLESGQKKDAAQVDLKEVVTRAVHMLMPLADKREVALKTSMDSGCVIVASADDVHQIVFNLIENAIKYNSSGGMAQVLLYKNAGSIVLIVEDDGIGIPDDDLPKIFDRFYRVDKARSRAAGGTGLGLSIVRETVEKLGGIVKAVHRQPKGTRFTVSFPEGSGGGQ